MAATVAFVDDDENWLRAMRRTLLATGVQMEILTFQSTAAAIEAAATRRLTVVVTDYMMPDMDGVKFLERLRELQPDTFRIIISGYPGERLFRAAINRAQVHRFIEKPSDGRVIVDAVLDGLRQGERLQHCRDLEALTVRQEATIARQRELLEQVAAAHPELLPPGWEGEGGGD